MKSRWTSDNVKDFKVGDIICEKTDQSFKRLIVYVDDVAIWVTGLVHCALTENNDKHPIYPIYIDNHDETEFLLRLGNLNDFLSFVDRIQDEVKENIENMKDEYYRCTE